MKYSVDLPAVVAVRAGNEGGHRLIGGPGLELEEGALALLALATLERIRCCAL